jgi:hypothetical protein
MVAFQASSMAAGEEKARWIAATSTASSPFEAAAAN